MEAEKVAAELSERMKWMLRRSRALNYNEPPQCFGPANTKKALRERGLGHGDFVYLTSLGLAVRAILLQKGQGDG